MTLQRPMFPPRGTVPHSFPAPVIVDTSAAAAPAPKPAKICRRGLLGTFLALVPTAAAAGATAALPALTAPPTLRESRRLLWLGEQLDQAETDFVAALARKAKCRTAAELAYPEPPEEITWLPGEHPPLWCGTREETDVDGEAVYWKGNPRHFRTTARQIAAADLLQDYLDLADKRTRAAREAARLLPIARKYEADVEQAIEETGYRAACHETDNLARRIDRIATLIYKCECLTFEGAAIKALALLVATKTDEIDDYIAHRSKVLYATKLADDVVKLRPIQGGQHA